MNLLKENIAELVKKVITEKNLFLIDLVIRGNERNRIIEIFVDGEQVISAEDCANISRELNKIIETRELLKSSYRLDVSTPGVERPLKYLGQYSKHLNRIFNVMYKAGEDKLRLKGELIKIDNELLSFKSNKEIIINFNDIIKATVEVSFN